ncbi:unknown similar to AMEV226 [Mythimna separata entomopoxvirus 'L']|uniref:Uncharacterized protein n=1 Tax=Mythimna separata entomopoxvirus 'L' TaxID=1293572 RepID=A0A916KQI1_9POXV|nr:unknown similar to AMEV226 [Mythimna separata entomopoxvirus 'L']CCU56449.1 unknown similar to AMEV226 [Mythimna separata entomopoxvirus 'L']
MNNNNITVPEYWDVKNINNDLETSVSHNIFYFHNIYKKYKKNIKNKKILKKFDKMYKLHMDILNILNNNTNSDFFDKLLNLDQKIYSNIYLIKLKYELLLETNIINIIGCITIISYIVNTYYGYNVENSTFLKCVFNNINADNPMYMKYIDNYKLFMIHIIDNVVINNENIIKTSINEIIKPNC